jgi:hypothetical protein
MGPGWRIRSSRGAFSRRALRDPVEAVVLPERRHEAALHPLELEPEDVQDVRPLDRLLDPPEDVHPQGIDPLGKEGLGAADRHLGPQLEEPEDVGAGHPGVEDVAHDADLESLDPLPVIPDREEVQERLGGMLVRAVPGVDHVRGNPLGQEARGPRRAVADHDHVDPHRLEVPGRVDQGLPLLHRGSRGGDVHRVGAQALLGELEGDAGAGGGLHEEVHDRLPAQDRAPS